MKFDSKSYLFYKISEVVDNCKHLGNEGVSNIIDLLGDFKINPGSLKVVNKPYIIGDGIECKSFAPENIEWNTLENIMISYNLIEIVGYYNGNKVKLNIESINNYSKEDVIWSLAMTIIDKTKGIHYYNSSVYYPGSLKYKPLYAFYDADTLSSLINSYGFDENTIISLDPYKLEKNGIYPDKSSYIEGSSFDCSTEELIHKMLSDMPYDELENTFESFVKDNEEDNSEVFIKELKLTNNK